MELTGIGRCRKLTYLILSGTIPIFQEIIQERLLLSQMINTQVRDIYTELIIFQKILLLKMVTIFC